VDEGYRAHSSCLITEVLCLNSFFVSCCFITDKFGAAMTLVKTDIGGNITVWIFFCKIAVINSISIQSFSFPICYIGK
jgi:hypothetical protein